MRFRFSPRTTSISLFLAVFMLSMSYWQSTRHGEKVALIAEMEKRLKLAPEPISSFAANPNTDWGNLIHRRLTVNCSYDYQHEMILRNRRHEDKPGAFVITPCKLEGNTNAVLVNRGFVSLAFMQPEQRQRINRPTQASFTGLVKENMERKMFSPKDPPAGGDNPWIDAWLRVNTQNMQKQIPYPLLPIYLEIIPDDAPLVVDQRLIQTQSGRDEMFYLGSAGEIKISAREQVLDPRYPIAVFDTVIPPGRHLGYIYEWAIMALMTVIAGVILQFGKGRAQIQHQESVTEA